MNLASFLKSSVVLLSMYFAAKTQSVFAKEAQGFVKPEVAQRIRVVYHDLSIPGKVFLIPTLASSILVPCVIEDILIGSPDGYSYLVSKKSPKRLEINTAPFAQTTN